MKNLICKTSVNGRRAHEHSYQACSEHLSKSQANNAQAGNKHHRFDAPKIGFSTLNPRGVVPKFIALFIVFVAMCLIINGSYIHIKAQLAQYLLQQSWHSQQLSKQGNIKAEQHTNINQPVTMRNTLYTSNLGFRMNSENSTNTHLSGKSAIKPWPWFDSYAIAKLGFPSLNKQQIVLAGDSGQALAFAPGMSYASIDSQSNSTIVISGHRDTHFALLQYLNPSEIITLEDVDKNVYQYKINDIKVIDINKDTITQTDYSRLVLVTCYPFDSDDSNTPWRYVIEALPVNRTEVLDAFTAKQRSYELTKALEGRSELIAVNSSLSNRLGAQVSF